MAGTVSRRSDCTRVPPKGLGVEEGPRALRRGPISDVDPGEDNTRTTQAVAVVKVVSMAFLVEFKISGSF